MEELGKNGWRHQMLREKLPYIHPARSVFWCKVISGLPKTGKNERPGFFNFSVSGVPVFRRPLRNAFQIFSSTGVRCSGVPKTRQKYAPQTCSPSGGWCAKGLRSETTGVRYSGVPKSPKNRFLDFFPNRCSVFRSSEHP